MDEELTALEAIREISQVEINCAIIRAQLESMEVKEEEKCLKK